VNESFKTTSSGTSWGLSQQYQPLDKNRTMAGTSSYEKCFGEMPWKLGSRRIVFGFCFGADRQSEASRWDSGGRRFGQILRPNQESFFNAFC
jgi:hypothetical protein